MYPWHIKEGGPCLNNTCLSVLELELKRGDPSILRRARNGWPKVVILSYNDFCSVDKPPYLREPDLTLPSIRGSQNQSVHMKDSRRCTSVQALSLIPINEYVLPLPSAPSAPSLLEAGGEMEVDHTIENESSPLLRANGDRTQDKLVGWYGEVSPRTESQETIEETKVEDSGVGERLPYNDYTTVDFLYDLVSSTSQRSCELPNMNHRSKTRID